MEVEKAPNEPLLGKSATENVFQRHTIDLKLSWS